MSFVLDLIIIAIFALIIITGYRRGFFKSVMTLCSGIASLLVAYTFTPALSAVLKEKFFLSKISGSIADTLASVARAGADAAQNAVYDLSKLIDNEQVTRILEKYGADSNTVTQFISGTEDTSYKAIEDLSNTVASPIAQTASDVCAFIIIFIGALIVLRVLTAVIGSLFKLPVLKSLDKIMGLVFGVISALLFVWLFALLAESLLTSVSVIAPGVISPNTFENSILLKFFAEYNFFDLLGRLVK